MDVVIFSRVSTEGQDLQRQINELRAYCKKLNYNVAEIFTEKITGVLKNSERKVLTEMISFCEQNNIKKVLCWEMSRLGRSTVEVLQTVEHLTENRISLYIYNFNIETLNSDGEKNPISNLLIQILSSIAEMERVQIRQRIKSGYDNFRNNGGVVGRKKGYKKSKEELLNDHSDVVRYLNKGRSVREIMKLTNKSNGTVMKLKKLLVNN